MTVGILSFPHCPLCGFSWSRSSSSGTWSLLSYPPPSGPGLPSTSSTHLYQPEVYYFLFVIDVGTRSHQCYVPIAVRYQVESRSLRLLPVPLISELEGSRRSPFWTLPITCCVTSGRSLYLSELWMFPISGTEPCPCPPLRTGMIFEKQMGKKEREIKGVLFIRVFSLLKLNITVMRLGQV